MASSLRNVSTLEMALITRAFFALRDAKRDLSIAGARRAAGAVARALKSVDGARRHALRCAAETPEDDPQDDGERLSCEGCGESFNAFESGDDALCVRCAP